MRSLLLLSIALLPVAATAQARTVSAFAPETTMTAAISGMPAAAPAPPAPLTAMAVTHQMIRTVVDPNFAHPLMSFDEGSSTTFGGPAEATAPKLATCHPLDLSKADMANADGETTVAVSAIVDPMGVPQHVQIAHSAGARIDESALAAVKSYRFTPATVDHARVDAPVTIEVKIDKQ
jgi:TonB family protein